MSNRFNIKKKFLWYIEVFNQWKILIVQVKIY